MLLQITTINTFRDSRIQPIIHIDLLTRYVATFLRAAEYPTLVCGYCNDIGDREDVLPLLLLRQRHPNLNIQVLMRPNAENRLKRAGYPAENYNLHFTMTSALKPECLQKFSKLILCWCNVRISVKKAYAGAWMNAALETDEELLERTQNVEILAYGPCQKAREGPPEHQLRIRKVREWLKKIGWEAYVRNQYSFVVFAKDA